MKNGGFREEGRKWIAASVRVFVVVVFVASSFRRATYINTWLSVAFNISCSLCVVHWP